ncbi:MAG: menaquinone biosynthesis protein [Verrucomicrobiales bacterium]|nr:menaquinone biosynthesis protein [Verrucomicrobiales bacterium]
MNTPFGEPSPDAPAGRRLAPLRVGSVGYLNAAPLTFTAPGEVLLTTPAELARWLRRDELDAALVSIHEVLVNDRYDLLDGLGIISRGPVKSVVLAHRCPLRDIGEVWCDPASLTSVGLVQVLLAEHGVRPRYRSLVHYADAGEAEAVLLIGDRAIEFQAASPPHAIWDLGEAWRQLTGLPFVYAGWALRRDATTAEWRGRLRALCREGIDRIEDFIAGRPAAEQAFCRRYFRDNIAYDLGDAEKAGLRRFAELLVRHTGVTVFAPRFLV